MADAALAHEDRATGLELVNEASTIHRTFTWELDQDIAYAGRLAGLRYRAGDEATARMDAEATLSRYEAAREQMQNYKCAGALRPLAEAHVIFGDRTKAMSLYTQTVEAGAVNPNARMRALDLADTCCSLAASAFEPNAQLVERLEQVYKGLDHPW
jgi:hypothetical protein